MTKQEILEKLKRNNPGLSYGHLEGLLKILSFGVPLDAGVIIRKTGLPKETVTAFIRSMSPFIDDEKKLLPEVKSVEMHPFLWSMGDFFEANLQATNTFSDIRKEYKKKASREYDQFYALPETTIKKARLMIEKGEVSGKNIALLGDDDMVSLALILLQGGFRKLTVFDIDEELLAFIKAKSIELGNENVHIEKYDCREDLRDEFLGRFDNVMTDPPYTRYGAELFLNRALELVGAGGATGRKIFFFYGNSIRNPEKFLKTQEMLNRANVLIEDKISSFARYDGAESIGSTSSLYILQTLASTVIQKNSIKNRKIYTYETGKEEKFPFVDHLVLKATGVSTGILHGKNKMLSLLNGLCRRHRLKVVDTKVTEFKGKGYTFVLVLSNSNLTVHTWPEYNAVHFDLVTCSPIYDKPSLPDTVSELFGTDSVEVNFIE